MKTFYNFGTSRFFWIFGAVFLLLMESIALYFQYALDLDPCALCVQIRAWILGALIISIFTSFVCNRFVWRWIGLTLTTVLLSGGLYTSWYSWGVEKGEIISGCSFGAGFPSFMPLDEWIPLIFAAPGICGQSPEMWFGLSMNEGLLIALGIPVIVLLLLWILHLKEMVLSLKKT